MSSIVKIVYEPCAQEQGKSDFPEFNRKPISAITTHVSRPSARTSTFSVHHLKTVRAMMPVVFPFQTSPAHRMLTVAHGENKIDLTFQQLFVSSIKFPIRSTIKFTVKLRKFVFRQRLDLFSALVPSVKLRREAHIMRVNLGVLK